MSEKCRRFTEMIMDDLAGELSREKQEELYLHLEGCAECTLEKSRLEQALTMLGEFEEEPIPGHFFVSEESRLSVLQLISRMSLGARLAGAAVSAMLLLVSAFILVNTHVRMGGGSVVVAFGNPPSMQDSAAVKEDLINAVLALREEDKREVATMLGRQQLEVRSMVDRLDQKVDTRLTSLEGRVFEAMESNNRLLRTQVEAGFYNYSEVMRDQQLDLRNINSRLDRLILDGRRRETQNGTIMATLAQYGLSNYRSKGGLYED